VCDGNHGLAYQKRSLQLLLPTAYWFKGGKKDRLLHRIILPSKWNP
jgi:hypothetical protein